MIWGYHYFRKHPYTNSHRFVMGCSGSPIFNQVTAFHFQVKAIVANITHHNVARKGKIPISCKKNNYATCWWFFAMNPEGLLMVPPGKLVPPGKDRWLATPIYWFIMAPLKTPPFASYAHLLLLRRMPLVGGWTNPFEKIRTSNWTISPK